VLTRFETWNAGDVGACGASGPRGRQRATYRPDNVVDGKCEERRAHQRAYLLVCKRSPLRRRSGDPCSNLLAPADESSLTKLSGVHLEAGGS
jgi:hypothetical protein